jgi:hypothetical protein
MLYNCPNQETNRYQKFVERAEKTPTFAKILHEHPSNSSKKNQGAKHVKKKN